MNELLYTTDFQVTLLLCLLKDKQFWDKVSVSLRLEDFGPMCLRFMYELAILHNQKYGALPAVETMFLLVDSGLKSPIPEVTTFVPPAEAELLVTVLGRYRTYVPTEPETRFYADHLSPYIAVMRWNAACEAGMGTSDMLSKATEIKEEIARINTGRFKFSRSSAPVPKEQSSSGTRYGIGISNVDGRIAGGLMRKQAGLICAGTGVGKSNLGINLMANLTWKKSATLYVTLELTDSRINERYQAMLAGIPASLFKKDIREWPECYQRRYRAICSDRFKLRHYGTTVDFTDGDYGVDHIDSAIKIWKEDSYKNGLNPDVECVAVVIDWLDRVSSEGLGKVNRNSSEERIYFHITEKLYQMANKHNIMIWTATQAKTEAKTKEFITSKDIAWGASKLHLMDVGVGMCPKNSDEKLVNTDTGLFAENEDAPGAVECSRMLNVSFLKSRDTTATDSFVPVYQGPTLKFWSRQADAVRHKDAIEADPYYGLEDVLDM